MEKIHEKKIKILAQVTDILKIAIKAINTQKDIIIPVGTTFDIIKF